MFAFIVSYGFLCFFFYIFDINSLAVVPNCQRQWFENELVASSCHRIFHGYAELIDDYYDRTD